jgi:hypothetical protein
MTYDCSKCYRPIKAGDEREAFGQIYHSKCAPQTARPPKREIRDHDEVNAIARRIISSYSYARVGRCAVDGISSEQRRELERTYTFMTAAKLAQEITSLCAEMAYDQDAGEGPGPGGKRRRTGKELFAPGTVVKLVDVGSVGRPHAHDGHQCRVVASHIDRTSGRNYYRYTLEDLDPLSGRAQRVFKVTDATANGVNLVRVQSAGEGPGPGGKRRTFKAGRPQPRRTRDWKKPVKAPAGAVRCNCESRKCGHDYPCPRPAGRAKALYVGAVCDACASGLGRKNLVTDAAGRETPTGREERVGFNYGGKQRSPRKSSGLREQVKRIRALARGQ